MSIRDRATSGQDRESLFAQEAAAAAYELGGQLVAHDGGYGFVHPDGTTEALPGSPTGDRPAFAAWQHLRGRLAAERPGAEVPALLVPRRRR